MEIQEILDSRFTEVVDPDVLAKARAFMIPRDLALSGTYPFFLEFEDAQDSTTRYQGRDIIMLGSNNYLGLTTHPRVREASAQAVTHWGTSFTGARTANGTHCLHSKLEERLASFLKKEAALVFTTGYQASVGILTSLVGTKDLAVLDKYAHASLADGARLAAGEMVRFGHNDVSELERVLSSWTGEGGTLVIVDGLYSMHGDLCNLPEVLSVCEQYNARLLVDDAHGIGVLGPGGSGTAAHFGVSARVDLIMGTFSKSLGSIGGFVAGPRAVIDYIRHTGRPFLFSASLPAACLAAADAALSVLLDEPELVSRVRANADYWWRGLSGLGLQVLGGGGAVVGILAGPEARAVTMWRELFDAGVYTNLALYPSVPREGAVLRTSVSANHTKVLLDRALDLVQGVFEKHGWLPAR